MMGNFYNIMACLSMVTGYKPELPIAAMNHEGQVNCSQQE